jgi:hypothetical protein
MKRTSIQTLVAAIVLAAAAGLLASAASADDFGYGYDGYYPGHPKLFRNYYVGGPGQGAPAQLYVSPRPTPPYVGHTWITYEPFMPHEFLYQHHRTYWAHHGDGTCTKTKVKWCAIPTMPFVRTLNAGSPLVGTEGLLPTAGKNCFAPWQNPWALAR